MSQAARTVDIESATEDGLPARDAPRPAAPEDRLAPFRTGAADPEQEAQIARAKAFMEGETFRELAALPALVSDSTAALDARRAQLDHRIAMLRAIGTVLQEERAAILAVHPDAREGAA